MTQWCIKCEKETEHLISNPYWYCSQCHTINDFVENDDLVEEVERAMMGGEAHAVGKLDVLDRLKLSLYAKGAAQLFGKELEKNKIEMASLKEQIKKIRNETIDEAVAIVDDSVLWEDIVVRLNKLKG